MLWERASYAREERGERERERGEIEREIERALSNSRFRAKMPRLDRDGRGHIHSKMAATDLGARLVALADQVPGRRREEEEEEEEGGGLEREEEGK